MASICNNACSKGSAILDTNGILSEKLSSIVGKIVSLNQRQLANNASYFLILFDISIDHLLKLTSRFRNHCFIVFSSLLGEAPSLYSTIRLCFDE
mmetsp:Transcript_9846/g.20536  ORF Transcript_9846/g.20536 Transcript_9846/m.20536 type:complete len:95 (-) Transcript_9846:328-612(-)